MRAGWFWVAILCMFAWVTNIFVDCSCSCSVEIDPLGQVTIPSNWTSVGTDTFSCCYMKMVNISIPSSVTRIEDSAFAHSSFVNVSLPDSITYIGPSAFRSCEYLQWVRLPQNAEFTALNSDIFASCALLTDLVIPPSVTLIDRAVFQDCNALTSIVIPDSVTFIGRKSFEGCKSLYSIDFGAGLVEIEDSVFQGCMSLSKITFGNSLRRIGNGAFLYNGAIKHLVLPPSIRQVGALAFGACITMESVTFQSTTLDLGLQVFFSTPALTPGAIKYPRTMANVTGFSSNEKIDLQCSEDSAGSRITCLGKCRVGYGNSIPHDPDYFSCEECEAGHFSADSSTSVCTPCPAGQYTNVPGSLGCQECPAGSSCPTNGTIDYISCDMGSFQSRKGKTTCEACPPGSYQESIGAASCEPCEAGKASSNKGNMDSSMCIECAPGTYASVSGLGTCSECGKDFYTGLFDDKVKCLPCPEGQTTEGLGPAGNGLGAAYCVRKSITVPCSPGNERDMNTGACAPCAAGRYSAAGMECAACSRGTYSAQTGASACAVCPAGRHSAQTSGNEDDSGGAGAATVAEACPLCPVGTYVNVAGAPACFACPPGSYCPATGQVANTPCPVGKYTDVSSLSACRACSTGRYQNTTGAAKCDLCMRGRYGEHEGMNSSALCLACAPGKYASQMGCADCDTCAKGQFQQEHGQLECSVCTEVYSDPRLTSTADHTGCEVNEALYQATFFETMYTDGVALAGTFFIAIMFILVGSWMAVKREKNAHRLGTLTGRRSFTKAFLTGIGFASGLFATIGIWGEAPALAIPMLLFRLLHFVGGAVLVTATFTSSKRLLGIAERVVGDVSDLAHRMDTDFALKNNSLVSLVIFLTLCDLAMLQFLPWKGSRFFEASKGFPTLVTLQLYMVLTTVSTFGQVLCQLVFLIRYSTVDSPSTSLEAQVLYGINITFSCWSTFMGFVQFCLKGKLLRSVEKQIREESFGSGIGMGTGGSGRPSDLSAARAGGSVPPPAPAHQRKAVRYTTAESSGIGMTPGELDEEAGLGPGAGAGAGAGVTASSSLAAADPTGTSEDQEQEQEQEQGQEQEQEQGQGESEFSRKMKQVRPSGVEMADLYLGGRQSKGSITHNPLLSGSMTQNPLLLGAMIMEEDVDDKDDEEEDDDKDKDKDRDEDEDEDGDDVIPLPRPHSAKFPGARGSGTEHAL